MTAIHVCPLSRRADVLAASRAGSVVTLLARGAASPPLPRFVTRHLRLDVSDIATPLDGHTLPAHAHAVELLSFATSWDRREPLLIHCYAGVSRSTAACFAVLCAIEPDVDEDEIARRLRAASPAATPNRALVTAADDVLGRSGRMVRSIMGIGRGADCFEGDVFSLPVPACR